MQRARSALRYLLQVQCYELSLFSRNKTRARVPATCAVTVVKSIVELGVWNRVITTPTYDGTKGALAGSRFTVRLRDAAEDYPISIANKRAIFIPLLSGLLRARNGFRSLGNLFRYPWQFKIIISLRINLHGILIQRLLVKQQENNARERGGLKDA